jgi:diguanylate cyclase
MRTQAGPVLRRYRSMTASPASRQEARRLAFLHSLGLLDSAPEATADAIATAAASIANVPMSALTLIDADRQWFKASCGLGVAQTGRDLSFCTHTILCDERLVVEDTRLDTRFRDNPFVKGAPHVRFYAGFVLRLEGHALGALCVIDDMPRRLSGDQVARLQDLSRYAARWMAQARTGA